MTNSETLETEQMMDHVHTCRACRHDFYFDERERGTEAPEYCPHCEEDLGGAP